MRLSAKAIVSFQGINSFTYGNQWTIRAGEPNSLYFQIVDLDQNGLRYMAGANSTPVSVSVKFPSIDDAQVVNAAAVQETDDKSIWRVDLTDDEVPHSGNVVFSITENGVTRSFSVLNLMSVEYPGNDGSC